MSKVKLQSQLTLFDVTNLVVGAIIGADIYVASAYGARAQHYLKRKNDIGQMLIWVLEGGCKMKIFPYTDVESQDADSGAEKVKVRWLITKEMGAPHFAMRLFEVGKGGCSPFHNHAWEHEVFILEGEGTVMSEKGPKKFKQGDVVFVLPNEKHQFRNEGKGTLKFLCLVPIEKKSE